MFLQLFDATYSFRVEITSYTTPSSSSSSSSTSSSVAASQLSEHTRQSRTLTTGKPIRTLCKFCSLCSSRFYINFTCHFITHCNSPGSGLVDNNNNNADYTFSASYSAQSIATWFVLTLKRTDGPSQTYNTIQTTKERAIECQAAMFGSTHNSQFRKPKLSKHTFNTMPLWQGD